MEKRTTEQIVHDECVISIKQKDNRSKIMVNYIDIRPETKYVEWVRVDDEIKFLKRIYDCLIIMRTKKDIDIDTLAIVINGRLNELSQSSPKDESFTNIHQVCEKFFPNDKVDIKLVPKSQSSPSRITSTEQSGANRKEG